MSNYLMSKESNENNENEVNNLKVDIKINEDINLSSKNSTKESFFINEDNQEENFKCNVEKEESPKELLNSEKIKEEKKNENILVELNNKENTSQNIIIEIKNNEKEDDENQNDKKVDEQKEDHEKKYDKKEDNKNKDDKKEEDQKEDDQKEEEKNEEEEKSELDEEEEEENNEKEKSEENLSLNKINFINDIHSKHIKKIEKEIEESTDRISYLIEKLIESRKGEFCSKVKLSEREVFTVIEKSFPIIQNEPSMLELEPPLYICGDIHGQFYDLLRVFDILKYPPESKFLFLGDYVDRGKKSLECILLLLCLKIKYPSRIYLLRGNHESAEINRTYGFYDECKRKVSVKIYKKFCDLFNILPFTALVGEKILCMHGGLAYELEDIEQLKHIKRPCEIPNYGLTCDLVWSDPDDYLFVDFGKNNDRGISVCFSKSAVENFNKNNNIDLICRAHQVVEEGFQFFADMKLITIFTAPNYMGEFDNKGGILKVNEDMICSLIILKPNYDKKDKFYKRKYGGFIN